MGKTYVPSRALPDFFKSDLRLGEKHAHPMPGFLDETAERVALAAYLALFDLAGSTASPQTQRLELERLGFETESLSESRRGALYRVRHAIVATRGTLSSIRTLAEVFFDGARVRVGSSPSRRPIGTASSFRLGDREAARNIWVRLGQTVTEEAKAEFARSANRLVPVPYRVTVVDPKRIEVPSERACLGRPRAWDNRRLACPTFPR